MSGQDTESFEVQLRCSKCGGFELFSPEGVATQADLLPDSVITCAECKHKDAYGALIESAVQSLISRPRAVAVP